MRPDEKKVGISKWHLNPAYSPWTWTWEVPGSLGFALWGEALLDALHLLQSVPAAVLQTEFDRSRSSDRNPKFHKLTSSTSK